MNFLENFERNLLLAFFTTALLSVVATVLTLQLVGYESSNKVYNSCKNVGSYNFDNVHYIKCEVGNVP